MDAPNDHDLSPLPDEDLLDLQDSPILNVTFDQLRTLSLLHRRQHDRALVGILARHQSSIRSQIRHLDGHISQLCFQSLGDFGKDRFQFTEVGESMCALAEKLLALAVRTVRSQQSVVGKHLRIATTTYTLWHLQRAWDRVKPRIGNCELRIQQVRTRDFWATLRTDGADLVLGAGVQMVDAPGVFRSHGMSEEPLAIPLSRSDTVSLLVPKHLADRIPLAVKREGVSLTDMADLNISLIMQDAGIIVDLLTQALGGDIEGIRRRTKWTIADVTYALNLLRSGVANGGLIALSSLADREVARSASGGDAGVLLEKLELAPVFRRSVAVTGLFCRPRKLDALRERHPMRILWETFRAYSDEVLAGQHAEHVLS